mmetsp:Transcript_17215/g.47686  ORF Transcript_17215/g.47686 Transcript_17215/m.47686 type:complete len:188 (-) Transcript_17215:147-710(-)|eukprot:CAMPEP_0198115804 /NCGR_PEP_ID=MMETSP1442-20131203/7251_1 /TAXON_ID= /ORGANISM="Craspedostauros australis, Strain CCMP3328" /LENGTH=187 /DNA_ID=CAMNT_0043773381 /DNA_START=197 /DNA_END=760 /DNA_ORIENTATION=+
MSLSSRSLSIARHALKAGGPMSALTGVSTNVEHQFQKQSLRSMTILSKQSGEEYKKMNYNERMKKTGRPVSPHVAIYTFPISAITSILNRVTGVTLSFGCLGLGAIELVGGSGSSLHLMEAIGSSSLLLAAPAKLAVAFPMVYHYGGGIRHMMWDNMPDKLTTEQVEQSSYVLLGASGVVSLGLMVM